MRSNERYFADIRHAIRDFYQPGDQLRLACQYRESRKCEMCGGMVDIVNCYDMRNVRSGKVLVCGAKCIARYAEVIAQMGQTPARDRHLYPSTPLGGHFFRRVLSHAF